MKEFLQLCSENLFFENAHEWKPHHWNPQEPRTQCIQSRAALLKCQCSNSLTCSKTKSETHCLTKLFSIYQNKHWTIKRREDRSIGPTSHHIILKILGFLEALFRFYRLLLKGIFDAHGLQTPNEGINQRNLKIWANVADKICFSCT